MIIALILRSVQLIFALVILGLSVTLIKDQQINSPPATINYNAFCGGFGMIVAGLGIAAIWFEPLGGLVMAAIDSLASVFFLAGGLAVVIILRGISCTSQDLDNANKAYYNNLLNRGCFTLEGEKVCAIDVNDWPPVEKRCKQNEADAAFEFISFALCAGLAVLSFLAWKRGSGTKGALV